MASSSVSQDDIDNDFEKNSRRSRIRTARARQINPSGCRLESNQNNQTGGGGPAGDQDLELVGGHGHHGDHHQELNNAQGGVGVGGPSGSSASAASNTINKYDKLVAASDEAADHETSPKPIMRSGKEKRPNKIHHGNKGKQQRDRRKLREKRRSTGVVHLASTESTGGSTTGDDEESSDQAQPSLDRVLLETRRNTHQNESIANSYRQAQEKLGFSDADTSNNENQNGANVFTENSTGSGTSSTAAAGGQSGACSSLYPPSLPASFPSQSTRSSKHSRGRDKSPSDLEADDENDHDSLNQSETGSTLSLTTSTTNTTTTTANLEKAKTFLTNSNTPVIRPTTPTGENLVEDFSRVIEENKRLQSMLEEKDRRIHLLEFKVNQLMKDTLTISEENSRYQKENSTLVRALNTLTTTKDSSSSKPENSKENKKS